MVNSSKTQIRVALIGGGALVIAAVIGAYWNYKSNQPHPDPNKEIQYAGRVTDTDNNKIPNAKVIIEEDKNVQVQTTDSEGYFKVSLPESAKSIHVKVEKERYENFDRNVSLTRTGVEPIQLTAVKPIQPISTAPTPTPPPSNTGRAGKPISTKGENNKRRQHDASINALLNDNR